MLEIYDSEQEDENSAVCDPLGTAPCWAMDLPGRPADTAGATRAPTSGLKLMAIILVLFALLAAYGQWNHFRRGQLEKARVIFQPDLSPSP